MDYRPRYSAVFEARTQPDATVERLAASETIPMIMGMKPLSKPLLLVSVAAMAVLPIACAMTMPLP